MNPLHIYEPEPDQLQCIKLSLSRIMAHVCNNYKLSEHDKAVIAERLADIENLILEGKS